MPSTDRKLELQAKDIDVSTVWQPAVRSNGLIEWYREEKIEMLREKVILLPLCPLQSHMGWSVMDPGPLWCKAPSLSHGIALHMGNKIVGSWEYNFIFSVLQFGFLNSTQVAHSCSSIFVMSRYLYWFWIQRSEWIVGISWHGVVGYGIWITV